MTIFATNQEEVNEERIVFDNIATHEDIYLENFYEIEENEMNLLYRLLKQQNSQE